MKTKITATDYKNAQKIVDRYQYYISKYVDSVENYLIGKLGTSSDNIEVINYEDYLKFLIYDVQFGDLIGAMKIPLETIYQDIDSNQQSYKFIKIQSYE